MRRAGAAAAALALSLAVTAPAQAQQAGTLVVGVRRTVERQHVGEIVDLASGTRRPLPIGRNNSNLGGGFDLWSASKRSAHTLLRTDKNGNADFFDSQTLALVASFSLRSLPGTHDATFVGQPRLSPDGKYVLAYWLRNANRFEPELVVLDRAGHVVRQGSPLDYQTGPFTDAIAWMPHAGRYIHLGGSQLAICQLDTPRCLTAPLHLPPGTGANGSQVSVSPDGRRLALVLGQFWRNNGGRNASHSVLFVADIDGTHARQLTAPSKDLQEAGTDYVPGNPQWSPDGRWIAFTPHGANPNSAAFIGHADSCAETRIIGVDSPTQVLGTGFAQESLLKAGGQPIVACSFMEWVD